MPPDDIKPKNDNASAHSLPPHIAELRELDDAEIDKRGTEADQRLASLQSALEVAGLACSEAGAAFREKPSAATHSAAAVADQVLANARDAVHAHQTETSLLLLERDRRRAQARIRELAPAADSERVIAAARERFRTLAAAVRVQVAELARELDSDLGATRAAALELGKLQGELALADWRSSGGDQRGEMPTFADSPSQVSLAAAVQRLARDLPGRVAVAGSGTTPDLALGLEHSGLIALTVRARIGTD